MEGRQIDKSDILSNGKSFSKVRVPNAGSNLMGFLYSGWDYPFGGDTAHKDIRVYRTGRTAPNKNYRDLVIVALETKSLNVQWQFPLDDYVRGGVLDLLQLQIDVDNVIGVLGRGRKDEIFSMLICNAEKTQIYAR